jgi:outer membrane protein assembly factor BamD
MRCFLLLSLATILAAPLAAELVWSRDTGWRVEGGVLAGLANDDGGKALDLMNRARSAEEDRRAGKAIDLYETVTKKFPSSVYAPEAYYRIGLLRQQRREYFKAFDAYQALIQRYPNSERFSQVVAEQYRLSSQLLDGARNYLWGTIPGFKNREKSIEYFEQIVANAPYSDYAPLSLMNVARGHQRMGSTEEAIDALDRMINTYPRSVLTPDAYLKLAQAHANLVEGAYYDQASTKEAITYYEDFLILFPGDNGAGDAEKGLASMRTTLAQSKLTMADYYFKHRDNPKAAKILYNEAITVYPDSEIANRAKGQLALVEAKLAGQPAPVVDAPAAPGQPAKKKRFILF